MDIVLEHFDQLINHRWSDIAKAMGVGPPEVQDAADQISHLEPKPGLKYASPQEQYVTPDLIVEKSKTSTRCSSTTLGCRA